MMTAGSWAMWLTVSDVGLSIALGHGVERHQRAGRRAHHDAAQHLVGVGVFRIGLEDHLVGVVGRVDGRDLARAEGRVEQQADLVDRQAEARGGVAVDLDHGRAGAHLQVGVDVEDDRNAPHALFHQRRVLAQAGEIARAHAELVLARASAWCAMLIDWTGWKKMLMPGTDAVARRSRAITSQRRGLALGLVAQRDEDAARVDGVGGIAAAHRRHHRDDVGIALDDLGQRRLARHHGVERGVVRTDGRAGDLADILRREEALGDGLEQDGGEHEGAERDGEHEPRHRRPSRAAPSA